MCETSRIAVIQILQYSREAAPQPVSEVGVAVAEEQLLGRRSALGHVIRG